MSRRLIGSLLVVFGALGSGFTGLATAQAITYFDHVAGVIAAAIFAAITLGCLGGAWLLLRRRGTRHQPNLEWEPPPGEGWLPQLAWVELPDVLPRRPRLGSRPPLPSADVPPDEVLRRLWLVRAELAFDQSNSTPTGSFMGWTAMLVFSACLVLLFGAFLATGNPMAQEWGALGPMLVWLVVAMVVGGERASRNLRRYVGLRRLQRELEAVYAAVPGPIPAGSTVRLGDPTPRYDPNRTTTSVGP